MFSTLAGTIYRILMNEQTFIITGATSFVGTELIQLLLSQGHTVIALCRNRKKAQTVLPQNSRLILHLCDLTSISQVNQEIPHADVFIHLAWLGTGHDGRNDQALQNENVRCSKEALQTAHALGCRLFVHAGSQAEYGLVEGVLTEDTPCHPDNLYGKAKLEFGRYACTYCKQHAMKFLHLRILSIYGEGDKEWTLIKTCLHKMLRNEDVALSHGNQLWNYLYIKDAVKQIYLLCKYALTNPHYRSEIFLIASTDTRKLCDFVEEMRSVTATQSKLLYGYYRPMNVVELHPDVAKTQKATDGFIADYSFSEGVKRIINQIIHD